MERSQLIELVTRAQKGDSAAMEALFAAFYNDVYFFARKTVKDTNIACDITQETFMEIIRTIGNLKEPAAFVTWMKRITYHQCTRYFKKKKDVLVEEDEDGSTIFDTLADESEGAIPADVCEKEEFRNTILGIINELTEEQRSAVMMYYFDEMSVRDIAEIQGVSEGTVKSRLNYARKAIRKSVEDYEKKHGIQLHGIAFLPLFMLGFGKETMPAAKAAALQTAVAKASGAAAAAGSTAAVASGATLAAKIAAIPAVAKIAAAAIALVIAVGGGAALLRGEPAPEPTAEPVHICGDMDDDCICDECLSTWHRSNGLGHEDFCKNCGVSLGFFDADMDAVCDVCGEFPCGSFHHDGHYYREEDGICNWCGLDVNASAAEELTEEIAETSDVYTNCPSCGSEWDRNSDCMCDLCGWIEHFRGEGEQCGRCRFCGTPMMIVDENRNNYCDLCHQQQCSDVHPHMFDEVLGYCFICGSLPYELPTLSAPSLISLTVNDGIGRITFTAVEGATGYRIYTNGNSHYVTGELTYTITPDMLMAGENEIWVEAYNDQTISPESNRMTVGQLAVPEYHATGTGVEFPWGDVEHADGYIIYGDDGEYLTTIGLGESYDFSHIYTEDGFYFPYIQAYGEGWISSVKAGIPVSIGDNGGPIGY